MVSKKFVVSFAILAGISVLSTGCLPKKEAVEELVQQKQTTPESVKQVSVLPKPVEKKFDLYSSMQNEIPLFSILEISKLSKSIKEAVDKLLESSQGFYLLKQNNSNTNSFAKSTCEEKTNDKNFMRLASKLSSSQDKTTCASVIASK